MASSHSAPGRAPGRPPGRGILLVGAAFLTSGFTSLVLQVVWFKSLALLLGSTLYAMSTVVAVFLAGLALGAWLAGRVASRLRRPLAAYGLLEIGVGLYALVSLPLLGALDPVAGWSYVRFGASSPLYLLARLGLSALLLLPPTVLMGATLPWLVAWATRAGESLGRSLGLLYGLNTLGAVLGAAAAGFLLVPSWGLSTTSRAVGGLALLVGSLLAAVGWRASQSSAVPAPSKPAPGGARPAGALPAALLVGASGAVALVLEVAWARALGLVFGSSVYSFSLVLAAYLLGVALGSLLWGGRLADARRPWLSFAFLQAFLAAGVALGLWFLPRLPEAFISVLLASRQNLPAVYLAQAGLAGLIALVPCLALGALFPVGARLLGGDRRAPGESTGLAYAVNTVGTVSGSLAAGFLLLPGPGVQATLVGAVGVALLLAALGGWLDPSRRSRPAAARKGAPPRGSGGLSLGGPALVLGVTALALAVLAPPWNRGLFTLGLFRSATAEGGTSRGAVRAQIDARLADERILYYREGLHSVVSVHTVRSAPSLLTLRVDGKPDAGTGLDMVTQVMLGHVPMLWVGPQADVCVIGFGSGVTARAALAHEPESLTVVEIEPAVIEASRHFDLVNEGVLSDPRVTLVIEDGRQHLQRSTARYDMIVSQPPNPWIAGVNNLFTLDFYQRVRRALRPGGAFCAWLQTYELSPEAMGSLLAALHQVFPHTEAFLFERDLVIVATPDAETVPSGRLLDASRATAARDFLARFDFEADGFVAAHHVGSVGELLPRLPVVPVNRDDLPYVEYRAPLDLFRVAGGGSGFDAPAARREASLASLSRWVAPEGRPEVVAHAVRVLAGTGEADRAERWLAEARGEGLWPPGAEEELRLAILRGRSAALAEPDALAARQALDAGETERAEAGLRRALARDPWNGLAHLVAGRLSMRRDSLVAARAHFRAALEFGDRRDRCVAWMNLGIIEMRQGRTEAGGEAFRSALRVHAGEAEAYVNLARWYASLSEADSVRAVLERGRKAAFPALAVEEALAALSHDQPF